METIYNYLAKYTNGKDVSFQQACQQFCNENENYKIISSNDKHAYISTLLHEFEVTMLVKNTYRYDCEEIDLPDILAMVAKVANCTIDDLKSKDRKREFVEARHAYLIIADKLTEYSQQGIADEINRNHASVVYAKKNSYHKSLISLIEKVEKELITNENLKLC